MLAVAALSVGKSFSLSMTFSLSFLNVILLLFHIAGSEEGCGAGSASLDFNSACRFLTDCNKFLMK